MLNQYNAVDIERILREEVVPPPFPPASNREEWVAIRRTIGEAETQKILQQAEVVSQTDIPVLPASLYLEYKRNGERQGYQMPWRERRKNHTILTLAECLEYEGRFLDPLMDLTWAICEESSWAYPAHQTELTDLHNPVIDLSASLTGSHLAEMDLLLGTELDPMIRKRIHDEADHRLFTPYLTRHDHWWMYNTQIRSVNNWSGVCNGNVVMTALYLETDMTRLAKIIARAARSLDDYLDTYDVDGGSSEGPGPWVFGFSNYVLMAQLLEHRSNGRLAFMEGEFIRKIAQFPLKTVMNPGRWVNFADTESHTTFPGAFLVYVAQRLNLPDLIMLYHEQRQRGVIDRDSELPWMLRELFWRPDEMPTEPVRFIPDQHDWYSGMHWMFARVDPADPNALVLAAKGGHNGEMHNQNDVGHFIVQINGEQVIADIGRGRFTRFYFGDKRYEDFSCQSLGHACPVPNGQMQGPLTAPVRYGDGNWGEFKEEMRGSNYHAILLEHHADDKLDLIKIEMKHAYPPEANLDSLVRTVALHRDIPQGWVEVVDEVAFVSGSGTYESVLTTFGDVQITDEAVIIQGEKGKLRVICDRKSVQVRLNLVPNVPLSSGIQDVHRVIFEWQQPQQSGLIRLEITPVE